MTKRSSRKLSQERRTGAARTAWPWVVGIVFVAIIVLGFRSIVPHASVCNEDLRAVIIDQLSPVFPNEELRSSLTGDIEVFGLPVDTYEGTEIDVDLYRSLATMDYGVIVIRSHSGILELPGDATQRAIALFTNEPYSERKHVADQLRDRLLIVRPFEQDSELTFGITPAFVLRSMEGTFPSSVMVIAGCSVLGSTDMAEALVARGASLVVSWDRSVTLDHADEATAALMRHLLRDNMTVKDAVSTTNQELGPDPEYGALLKYYPDSAGGRTTADLLRK